MQNEWHWVKSCLFLESCCLRPIMRNSVLEELRVRRLADIQEEICCRAVWRWAILESKLLQSNIRNAVRINKLRTESSWARSTWQHTVWGTETCYNCTVSSAATALQASNYAVCTTPFKCNNEIHWHVTLIYQSRKHHSADTICQSVNILYITRYDQWA